MKAVKETLLTFFVALQFPLKQPFFFPLEGVKHETGFRGLQTQLWDQVEFPPYPDCG